MMRRSLIAVAAGAALVLAAGSASAAPRVVLTIKVIADSTFSGLLGGAASAGVNIITCDSAGLLSFGCSPAFTFSSGPFGTGWTANNVMLGNFGFFNTSFAGNAPGTSTKATLDATQNLLTNFGAGIGYFEVDLQAFDYNLPTASGPLGLRTLSGSASLTSGATLLAGEQVESFFYADGTNNAFKSNEISCLMAGGTSNKCDAPSTVWSDVGGGTFAMRDIVRYTLGGGGRSINTTSSGVVNPVPEPMSIALVGLALLGAAVASRRSKV